MNDLEELEAIETALVGCESSSHCFNLSPDIDKGFRVSNSKNPMILEIDEPEIEFRAYEEMHTFFEGVFGIC